MKMDEDFTLAHPPDPPQKEGSFLPCLKDRGILSRLSEDMAIQHILLACAVLRTDIEDITVERVWRELIKMWNYEYPRDVIAKVINEQSCYQYNWQSHRYEKISEVQS